MNRTPTFQGGSPFTKGTVLALVLFGFATFLALLYFISAGDTGRGSNDGGAHAASNGLNGYSGMARLLELEGYNVTISRSPSNYGTSDLLVLTPPAGLDVEEFEDLLERRYYSGPTLIILPKWFAQRIADNSVDDIEVEDGWVQLFAAFRPQWTEELSEPYKITTREIDQEEEEDAKPQNWAGLGFSGTLPTASSLAALSEPYQDALVQSSDGGILALEIMGTPDDDFHDYAEQIVVIVEPDLANNYGLADEARAEVALKLVEYANGGEYRDVTFDVTLNGLGGATNLLTLAFRPPFLAATICLLLAMLLIGWRAFIRFGPPRAQAPAIALGKNRLVTNGAGLILRARRLKLLAEPYIALTQKRLGKRLGIARPDQPQVEAALVRRLPDDPGFAARAEALRSARGPKDILRAARALKDLERKLD